MSRSTRLVPVLLLVAAWTAVFPASPAGADEVSGGRLDWGVRESFRTYITGPIAQGSWEVVDGATTVGDGGFRFHSAAGDYDADSGQYTASYYGGVHFYGHEQDDGSYELDLTIANPTVEMSGGSGTLYVDVITPSGTSGQVAFGALSNVGLDTSGDTVSATGISVTLTEDGATAFQGFYSAGEQLDPIDVTGDVLPEVEPDPEPPESESSTEDAADGDFTGAAVDWGVRRTFREYVTGDLVRGDWQLTDGAADGGAVFRFGDGDGEYNAADGTLNASFTGAVTFAGQGLDLTFGEPTVRVADGEGTLYAEVTSDGTVRPDVPLVTFPADELEPADDLLLIDAAPATLTADGAEVFGDIYTEGTGMDPVTVAVPLSADAEIPELPDLGSEPQQPTPSASPAAVESDDSDSNVLPISVGAVAVAGIAAGAVAVMLRRRNRAEPAPATAGAGAGSGTETDDVDTPTDRPSEDTGTT